MGLGKEIDDLREVMATVCEAINDLETRLRNLENRK